MTIDELRDVLEARTGPTSSHFGGDGFQAHCPGPRHKGTDDDPSLSIDPGDKRVVMKCFVGCEEEEICAELGIKLSSLYYDRGEGGPLAPLPRNSCNSCNSQTHPPRHPQAALLRRMRKPRCCLLASSRCRA